MTLLFLSKGELGILWFISKLKLQGLSTNLIGYVYSLLFKEDLT